MAYRNEAPEAWEEERDAAVLKRLKRKPAMFDELQKLTGLEEEPLRESLYRLTVDGDADYDYDEEGWRLPAKPRRMTKAQAVSILMDAAGNWANELTEYIIPADDDEDSEDWVENMSTTANRRATVNEIEEACKVLTPKEKA